MYRKWKAYYRLQRRYLRHRWQSKWNDQWFSFQSWFKYRPTEKGWIWHKEPASVFALYCFTILLWYWIYNGPLPEKAATVMAVVGALMSFRGEMEGKEKIAWTLLLLAFLGVEFRSLDSEHAANEERQQAAGYVQESNFLKILQSNQRDFDATMSQFRSVEAKDEAIRKQIDETSLPALTLRDHPNPAM